jgi:hypothetical protein
MVELAMVLIRYVRYSLFIHCPSDEQIYMPGCYFSFDMIEMEKEYAYLKIIQLVLNWTRYYW